MWNYSDPSTSLQNVVFVSCQKIGTVVTKVKISVSVFKKIMHTGNYSAMDEFG